MQVLTSTGYKDIVNVTNSDLLTAYAVGDGHMIYNNLISKQRWTPDMFPAVDAVYELDADGNQVLDADGNLVIVTPAQTSYEVFQQIHGDWTFYLVNGKWNLYKDQSIWRDNDGVCHAYELQIGDVVFDENNNNVTVSSIVVNSTPTEWWRLEITGDHSFISDSLTLHNASRYWVGGGASANWSATSNTNWGSTSGGSNNASVPTSTDDVTFDGAGTNGNTNSTISADITILSLNITSGYTSTMTHNAVLTIAGNWTFGTSYTIAGTSGVTISATSTITSGGKTWPLDVTFAGGSTTKTIVGDFAINGSLIIIANNTINKTTSEKINVYGGFIVNSAILTGSTIDIYLRGGTWSGSGNINIILFLNGNITISGSVSFAIGTLNYSSGTITTTGSTLTIQGTATTLNTNGVTWNNIISNVTAKTITLSSNLLINGLLTISGTTTLNKTTSETFTIGGGLTTTLNLTSTADIYLNGGTWSATSGILTSNIFLGGNVIISTVNFKGTIKYVSGNIICNGIFYAYGPSTFDTNGMVFNSVSDAQTGNSTYTLSSNLTCNGVFAAYTTTLATSNNSILILNGGLSINSGGLGGTADIYLQGGTWSGNSDFSANTFIYGNITISGTIRKSGGTITYLNGIVNALSATLNINATCTLINMHKVAFKAIMVNASTTFTMNQFFSGTPGKITQVTSTGANYTVTFTDNFEKIAKNVAISGCTLTKPMQLLVVSNPKFNTNRSSNSQGIRYINQSPNGIAKNQPSIGSVPMVPVSQLVSDPCFQMQG